jgi:hypothetical protein
MVSAGRRGAVRQGAGADRPPVPASLARVAPPLAALAVRLGPGAPRVRDRVTQGRVKFTFGVRAANHAVLAVRAVGLHGRSRGWLAAAAAAIGIDAALARLLDDPAYVPSWPQWALEWLDCALWALATEPHGDMLFLLTGTATPSVVTSTIDAVAGTDAVPVYNPARPWPPLGAGDAAGRVLRVAAVSLVPTAIAVTIRRRRGLPGGGANIMWSLAGGGLAAFGARHRDKLHAEERRRWAERTATQVHQEFAAAQAALAMASSPGHDFKKTLYALGLYGSDTAMAEARAQTARPAQLLERLGGHTLFEITRSTRIVPAGAGTLWLTDAQGEQVRAFLRQAEEAAVDGADQSIRVRRSDPHEVTVTYLGCHLRLRNDPPPLRARLDPSSVTLAIAAFQAADTVMTGELPARLVLPSMALLMGAAWRFRRRAPTAAELDVIVACSALSTALGFAASSSRWARLVTPLNRRAMPAIPFARGMLIVLGAHWSRLGRSRRMLLPAVFAGWAASTMRRERRMPAELLAGALDLLQGAASTWRLSDLVDAEANHLEVVLQEEFSAACEAARSQAAREELDRYARQLAIARLAIAELDGQLDGALVTQLEQDCAQVEEWLIRQRTVAAPFAGDY